MIPRHRHRPEDNVDSWLMSYADMITLLLCFFVIFVAVSEPKKERLEAITEGMLGKFGVLNLATPFAGAARALQGVIEAHHAFQDVALEAGDNSLTMELSSLSFYQGKTADFNPAMEPVLLELASALKEIGFIDYRITVEGMTSDAPFASPYFPSNWELSSARASRMVRFLIAQGIKPEALRAVGLADTRPKVPNRDTSGHPIAENRLKNERVVIKLERVL